MIFVHLLTLLLCLRRHGGSDLFCVFVLFISQLSEESESKAGAELLDIIHNRVSDDSVANCLVYVCFEEGKEFLS